MTVNELCARFSEIPSELRDEPTLSEFAATFGDLLAVAHKPSSCSTGHDPGNHFYLKLIGPISYFGYGLATRERVVQDMRKLLDEYAADPEGFAVSLLPEGTVSLEVRGPDCA
jgi:hypothetical protein